MCIPAYVLDPWRVNTPEHSKAIYGKVLPIHLERNVARTDGLADQMIKKIAVIGTGVIGSGWIIRLLAHNKKVIAYDKDICLLYTSPSPRDGLLSRMPSSA